MIKGTCTVFAPGAERSSCVPAEEHACGARPQPARTPPATAAPPETMLNKRTEAMLTVAMDEHDCEGEKG